jgi:signal transduction histidine kinase
MLPSELQADVDAVSRIDAVPSILEVICRTTGMGFAAVARVTDTHWVACSIRDEIQFGLPVGGELELRTTLCNEVRECGEEIVIDEVRADAAYAAHHTPAKYGFQSYISIPIRLTDGRFFGTLCAIDPSPAKLKRPEIVGMFRLFAQLIATQLESQRRLENTQADLSSERRTAELREQFIAVLGHDLRNPLASIASGAALLGKSPLDAKGLEVVKLLQNSVKRMASLIDDVLDFTRGRLGGGLSIERKAQDLQPVLEQVVAELRSSHPDRTIMLTLQLPESVVADRQRIAQLLSNLVANALTHGARESPVLVEAIAAGGTFRLSVANRGNPIPPAQLDRLFEPFFRGTARTSQQGLGLGLYIASEIARSHGGQLSVQSTSDETRFTLSLPSRRQ